MEDCSVLGMGRLGRLSDVVAWNMLLILLILFALAEKR